MIRKNKDDATKAVDVKKFKPQRLHYALLFIYVTLVLLNPLFQVPDRKGGSARKQVIDLALHFLKHLLELRNSILKLPVRIATVLCHLPQMILLHEIQ